MIIKKTFIEDLILEFKEYFIWKLLSKSLSERPFLKSIILFVCFVYRLSTPAKGLYPLSPQDQADGAPLLPLLVMESVHRPPLVLALE